MWLSDKLYELLPSLYAIAGLFTVNYFGTPLGYASGFLLLVTAWLIWMIRDDIKYNRDKAMALEAYAKQAMNTDAERKAGQLLAEKNPGHGGDRKSKGDADPLFEYIETLQKMEEKRKSERRNLEATATFPLHLARGSVAFDRRHIPDRRLNDPSANETGYNYSSEVIRQKK